VDNVVPIWTTGNNSLNQTVYCGKSTDLAAAQLLKPIATDNCSQASAITLVKTPGAFVPSGAGGAGSFTNTWIATDACANASAVFTQVITVVGLAVDASARSAPVAVGSNAVLKATVTPAVAGITVAFYLDGVLKCSGTTDASGYATCSVVGLGVEVYKVEAIAGGGCATGTAYVAVYDPTGGFVTGGGWFNSPAAAYVPDATLTGKANFGFVSKYKKGSTIPEGNTEFQFKAGNLNFVSTAYNSGSLVVATFKAIYKGVGTINGTGNYGFMVSAVDGQITGGGGADKFRIKIWDKNNGDAIVYDNNIGLDENAAATTLLGGGSIVIHEAKGGSNIVAEPIITAAPVTDEPADDSKPFKVNIAQNPTSTSFKIQVESDTKELITIRLYDVLGNMVGRINNIQRNAVVTTGDQLNGGTYFAEILQGEKRKLVKLIKLN
jgi:hypothetical protein